ncbi:MAG: hypothetical protein JWP37_354 [Mucilaginibacter sp.]|nr:hypothetical protein [Mucilaginibacter sp.]
MLQNIQIYIQSVACCFLSIIRNGEWNLSAYINDRQIANKKCSVDLRRYESVLFLIPNGHH